MNGPRLSWLDRLARKFGRYAIPNVTLYLVFGQGCLFILGYLRPELRDRLEFIPSKVMEGEIWRLVLFPFMPPSDHIVWTLITLMFLYFAGNVLERDWGAFRYNAYLFIGFVATIAVAWLAPERATTNLFIDITVFLAFAHLYPEAVIRLYMVFPVKAKWLALVTWGGLFLSFLNSDTHGKFAIQASVLNFFVFFGRGVMMRIKSKIRREKLRSQTLAMQDKPLNVCAVCGVSDKSDPQMDFRYCSACQGGKCYCSEHLFNHEHVI